MMTLLTPHIRLCLWKLARPFKFLFIFTWPKFNVAKSWGGTGYSFFVFPKEHAKILNPKPNSFNILSPFPCFLVCCCFVNCLLCCLIYFKLKKKNKTVNSQNWGL